MGRDKSKDVERTRISRKRKREKNIQKKQTYGFFFFTNVSLAEREGGSVSLGWHRVSGWWLGSRERGWERRASAADADAERAA